MRVAKRMVLVIGGVVAIYAMTASGIRNTGIWTAVDIDPMHDRQRLFIAAFAAIIAELMMVIFGSSQTNTPAYVRLRVQGRRGGISA
jgi:NADH:ubiquinone oxidoreductase subunit 6 (subunit J)